MSGVEGTPESQLRNLAERERWSIDVLLRLLTQLLPQVEKAAIVSYPFSKEGPDLAHDSSYFTEAVVKSYTGYVFSCFSLGFSKTSSENDKHSIEDFL